MLFPGCENKMEVSTELPGGSGVCSVSSLREPLMCSIRRRAELSCFLLPSTSKTNNKISTLLRLTGTTSKHWYALKSYCVYFCGSSPLLIAIFAFKTVLITLPMESWKMSVSGHAGPAALNFEINCFSCRCFVLHRDILLSWPCCTVAAEAVLLKLFVVHCADIPTGLFLVPASLCLVFQAFSSQSETFRSQGIAAEWSCVVSFTWLDPRHPPKPL